MLCRNSVKELRKPRNIFVSTSIDVWTGISWLLSSSSSHHTAMQITAPPLKLTKLFPDFTTKNPEYCFLPEDGILSDYQTSKVRKA